MNPKSIKNSALGGLAGGLLFGLMMGAMGTLPMIGKMVGLPNAAAGFVVHMIISASIGIGFGIVFGRVKLSIGNGLLAGATYGALWWLLGPLTLMPLFMGMGFGVNWTSAAVAAMFPSLIGHLMFGFVLGSTFSLLQRRSDSTGIVHKEGATPIPSR